MAGYIGPGSALIAPGQSVRIVPRQLAPWGGERRNIVWRNFGTFHHLLTAEQLGTSIAAKKDPYAGVSRRGTKRWWGVRRNPDWGGDVSTRGREGGSVGFGSQDFGGGGGGSVTPLSSGMPIQVQSVTPLSAGMPMPGSGVTVVGGESALSALRDLRAQNIGGHDPVMANLSTTSVFSDITPTTTTVANPPGQILSPGSPVGSPASTGGGSPGGGAANFINSILPPLAGATGTAPIQGTSPSPVSILLLIVGLAAIGYVLYKMWKGQHGRSAAA